MNGHEAFPSKNLPTLVGESVTFKVNNWSLMWEHERLCC